ncbi:MAG TPA: hypothetical protein VLA12_09760, partial [Planctomycetaceae bacterium]|nr:hypothetical protein [Planctomycetaceae bacterium]
NWQDQLWKFNSVGHFGSIRPWQEATNPITTEQSFRVKLQPSTEGGSVKVYLQGVVAGAGTGASKIVWKSPRIERVGKPPILFRDVRAITAVLEKSLTQAVRKTSRYLAAAFELRSDPKQDDLEQIAARYEIDPLILRPWLNYLGIAVGSEVRLDGYLETRLDGANGNRAVQGWQIPGLSALSIVGNASDEAVLIPGTVPPHKVAVHPRPERWIAVGWKSPISGQVRIAPLVKDAHNACGNGISWSIESRRGIQRRVLLSGNVDLGTEATIEPLENFAVRQGDVISLIIDARDGSHVCDLTEIDLEITEQQAENPRVWSLSKDCADSMEAGNPHDDSFGHKAVWHFYTGAVDGRSTLSAIPADSLIGQWLATEDKSKAEELAEQIQTLLSHLADANTKEPDKLVSRQLQSLDGPLFSQIDYAALARRASPEEMKFATLGPDPALFEADSEDLILEAPFLLEVELPAELCRDAEFVSSVELTGSPDHGGMAQVNVTLVRPEAASVLPGVPFLVQAGTQG